MTFSKFAIYIFFIATFFSYPSFADNLPSPPSENSLSPASMSNSPPPPQPEAAPAHSIEGLLEAKVGYFRPTKKRFRRIYSEGAIYGIEGSVQAYKQLYAWASVSYFPKSGKTIEGSDSTKLHLVPIGAGLKYLCILNSRNDSVYIGVGVLPTYLNIRVRSSVFVPKTVKWGVGGLFKAGFIVNLPYSFFLDFFADYMYLKINFSETRGKVVFRNRTDLSGATVGGGIGYRF